MIWTLLQLLASIAFLSHPLDRYWAPMDQIYAASLLAFHPLWHTRLKAPSLRTPGSLYFSFLTGFTVLMVLCDGPLLVLGLFWPTLLLRIPDGDASRRQTLALLQVTLAAVSLDQVQAPYLNLGLALASLMQVKSWGAGRLVNLVALTLCLGPILESAFFPTERFFFGPATDLQNLTKSVFLLSLPQVGLRALGDKR